MRVLSGIARNAGTSARIAVVNASAARSSLRPLRQPERAERVASYLSKYLAKWKEDGSCEVTETVLAAGCSYLNYVSRRLTGEEWLHNEEPPNRSSGVGLALRAHRGPWTRSLE